MFHPEKAYNSLAFLPPQEEIESKEVLKACIAAHQELSKLCIAGKLIPNQTVLINSIPLLESQASSTIENIVTTTDELFQCLDDSSASIPHAVKETLQYRTALYEGVKSLKNRPLTITTICDICSVIRGVKMDIRKIPGTTLVNDRTGKTIYTPPEGESILRDLLSNWQMFFHSSTSLDPLIQLALLHYQFEAIHPFTDGNGRTGRILNLLFLLEKGLLEQPILYLSRYIMEHKNDYYRLLQEVTTKKSWQEWILYIIKAIEKTSAATTKKNTFYAKAFYRIVQSPQTKNNFPLYKRVGRIAFYVPLYTYRKYRRPRSCRKTNSF